LADRMVLGVEPGLGSLRAASAMMQRRAPRELQQIVHAAKTNGVVPLPRNVMIRRDGLQRLWILIPKLPPGNTSVPRYPRMPLSSTLKRYH